MAFAFQTKHLFILSKSYNQDSWNNKVLSSKTLKNAALVHPSTRVANPPHERTHTMTRASHTRIVFSSHESAHIFTPFFGWFCCGACVCAFFSLACFTSLLLSPDDEPTDLFAHTHSLVRQVDDYFVFFVVVAFAVFLAPFENGFCFHSLGVCKWVCMGGVRVLSVSSTLRRYFERVYEMKFRFSVCGFLGW